MNTIITKSIIAAVFGTALISTNIMAKPEYNKGYQDGEYNAEKSSKKQGKRKHGQLTDSEGNALSKEDATELKADVEAYLADNPDSNPTEYLKEQGYTFNKESGAEKKGFGDRAKPSKEDWAAEYGVDVSEFNVSTQESKDAFKEANEKAGAELPEKKYRLGGKRDNAKIFQSEKDVLDSAFDQ